MNKKISGRLFWGSLIVLAGVLYLLFNIGILPAVWKPVILSWQMLLVVIGVTHLNHRHYIGGLLWTGIGVVFLLPELSTAIGFNYSVATLHSIIWPAAIILIGISLIIHPFRHHHHHHFHCTDKPRHHRHNQYSSHSINKDGTIYYNLIMNGVDEIFLGPVFRGGEINTILGGVELDLRKSTLPEGNTILKVESILGGITLYVPEDWTVEIQTDSMLGGFTDNRPLKGMSTDKRLIIDAHLILGGGTIKC